MTRACGLTAVLLALMLAVPAVVLASQSYVFDREWGGHGNADGQFDLPHGLSCDASGHIYVVERFGNRVQEFTLAGVFLRKFGSIGDATGQFRGLWGIACAPNGTVYMTDSVRNVVQRRRANGDLIREWGSALRLPLLPAASRNDPMEAAMPMQMVFTGAFRCCMVS